MSNIVDLTNRLADYLFDENQKAKQEVNTVMRGEILETYADRMIAMGREQGLLEGERKGLLEGERKGKVELLYEMKFSIEKIADKLCIPEEQVRDILRRD